VIATLLNVDEKKKHGYVLIKGIVQIFHINSSTEEYYMRIIFILHLEDLISSLSDRFMPLKETIISLQYNIFPYLCINKSLLFIREAVDFYMDDLPCFKDSIETEYDLWISKWTSVEPSSRPSTSTAALVSCDKTLYPNLYQLLKILAILPVSTASAERSFSTLRKSISEKLNIRKLSRRFSIIKYS